MEITISGKTFKALQKFCCDKWESRAVLQEIAVRDNCLYATDSYIVARVGRLEKSENATLLVNPLVKYTTNAKDKLVITDTKTTIYHEDTEDIKAEFLHVPEKDGQKYPDVEPIFDGMVFGTGEICVFNIAYLTKCQKLCAARTHDPYLGNDWIRNGKNATGWDRDTLYLRFGVKENERNGGTYINLAQVKACDVKCMVMALRVDY